MDIAMQQLKVLLLEDSEIDIEIVYQKLIESFNCPVILDKAQTEACFLHLIRNNQYDVILADYTLPGYNANAALEQVLDICPNTPFICVSGTIGEDIAVEMLKQGATDYVIKDRLERLPFAIRRAIKSILLEQETKEAEQKTKEMSESNRLILDSTNDGIGMLDREGNILNINDKFARRVGKTVEDAIGINFKTLLPEEIFGDLYEQRIQRFRNVFQTGQPEIFDDSRAGMWFNNRVYPVFRDGQVAAITLFSTDITDRKHAEEEARKNDILNKEAEMLRQADRNKNEFLNALSHELRNPLATIVAGFSLLSLTEDKQQTEKTKEIIQRQIDQLCHLVDDLLNLTRITNNKIVLDKERVDLKELTLSVVTDSGLLFEEKKICLEAEINEEDICIDVDPVRIKQIIGNLLNNAMKFTNSGGTVKILVFRENNEAVICVKDNGIGIEPEFLPVLFEQFKQADVSIDRRNGGLGLGLSITKGIAELHGGTVSVQSDGMGKGALFCIRLPLSIEDSTKDVG